MCARQLHAKRHALLTPAGMRSHPTSATAGVSHMILGGLALLNVAEGIPC
jgi:hypothetical protein